MIPPPRHLTPGRVRRKAVGTAPGRTGWNGTWPDRFEPNCSRTALNVIQCSSPPSPARVLSAINGIHSPAGAIMLSCASNLEEAHHKMALPVTRCHHSLVQSLSQFTIEPVWPVVDPRESVIPHSAIGNLSSSPNSARVMPRSRGVPRRGGSSASRGCTRSSPSPLVIPISSASPSSPPLSRQGLFLILPSTIPDLPFVVASISR